MTRLQPDTIRPECPKCGTQMLLARVVPDSSEHELRTFECPICEHSEEVVAKIELPASSG
jgi:transcription elongation factor Elf1